MEEKDFVLVQNPDIIKKTYTLERNSTLRNSLFLIVSYLSLEIAKQLFNFTLTTSNNDKLPIPSTLLVIITESTKLFIILIYIQFSSAELQIMGFSSRFAAPAFCYFFSNVIYLHGITLTAPPIWVILIQTRTLYTALLYKVVLKKKVVCSQIIGCALIVGSIALTRMSEFYSGKTTITLKLICLSQVASILSSIACLSIEVLLKNDERSFGEQQMWLYICGIFFGIISLFISVSREEVLSSLLDLQSKPTTIAILFTAVIVTALGGLCVPIIVKNLDSIVKDYLAATNNILLAFLTAILFPSRFPINFVYIFSLAVLITGILFYEKKPTKKQFIDCHKNILLQIT